MTGGAAFSPARRALLQGRIAADALSAPPAPGAVIAPHCLAFNGVACFSCRDACGEGAIVFRPAVGGARPRLVPRACTACGDCADTCPVGAITIHPAEAGDGG